MLEIVLYMGQYAGEKILFPTLVNTLLVIIIDGLNYVDTYFYLTGTTLKYGKYFKRLDFTLFNLNTELNE